MRAARRQFIGGLGAAAAGAVVAGPALADPAPDVRWRLTSAFQPDLDLIFGGAQTFAQALSDMTDGHFTIAVSAAGEIAPALEALDAVADGKADCAHTALSYSWNTEPAYVFATGAPFGMNARQHMAWLQEGGGGADRRVALRPKPRGAAVGRHRGANGGLVSQGDPQRGRFQRPQGPHRRVCGKGAPGARRDARSPSRRTASSRRSKTARSTSSTGLALTMTRSSARLKDGERQAISTVAPYYYYPGWWKGDMQLHLVVAKDKFAALPKSYQASLRAAAAIADESVRAKYDAANPGALKRLVIGGAQLRLFPQEALEAWYKTANVLYAQLAAENPQFKKVANSYMAFRADEYLWWQVAEYSFDNFMIRERRAKG